MRYRATLATLCIIAPTIASAEPCVYTLTGGGLFGPGGAATVYLSCIASQAWDGLSLALTNADDVATLIDNVDRLTLEMEWLLAAGPTTIVFDDVREGCPPTHTAEDVFWAESFVLEEDRAATIDVILPRDASGRSDLRLHLSSEFEDRGIVTQSITYSPDVQWVSGQLRWTDTLPAGTWTVGLSSNTADDWGCGADWGHMNILIH